MAMGAYRLATLNKAGFQNFVKEPSILGVFCTIYGPQSKIFQSHSSRLGIRKATQSSVWKSTTPGRIVGARYWPAVRAERERLCRICLVRWAVENCCPASPGAKKVLRRSEHMRGCVSIDGINHSYVFSSAYPCVSVGQLDANNCQKHRDLHGYFRMGFGFYHR